MSICWLTGVLVYVYVCLCVIVCVCVCVWIERNGIIFCGRSGREAMYLEGNFSDDNFPIPRGTVF